MNGFVFNLQLFAVYDMGGNDTLEVHSKGSVVSYGGRESINTGVHDLAKVYDGGFSALGGIGGTLNKTSDKTTNIAANALVSGKVIDNYTKNTVISGNSGADTIRNYAGGVTVRGNAGNDYIYNSTYSDYTINGDYGYVTIDGGNGNDSIYSYDPRVSINGGTGADYIEHYYFFYSTINGGDEADTIYSNGGHYSYIYGGDGNDSIYAYDNDYVTVNAGNGNDKVYGKYYFSSINGGSGNDLISITGGYNTLIGGNRADTIYNNGGDYSYLSGGDGNDYIYAYDNDRVTVNAGNGNDKVQGSYYFSSINGGSGSDLISITGSYFSNTINGGDGNDSIIAYGGLINGGIGADRISVKSSSYVATIKGGKGNDTLYGKNSRVLYQYSSGDGNDKIVGFNTNSTLQIGGGMGSYSSQTSGDNVLVSVGSSVITLSGAASLSSLNIEGTEISPAMKVTLTPHDDTYTNTVSGATIAAVGGNDTLDNTATNVSINAGTGSDSISNSGNHSTLIGGNGADTIYNNGGDYSYLSGGDGNDSIYAYGNDYVTVNAGNGNDKVRGKYYSSSIHGGSGSDLISITGGYSNTINGGDGNDSITAYGGSINGGAGADRISVKSSSYVATIKGGKGNDTLYGKNSGVLYQYSSGDGNDKIVGFNTNSTLQIGGGMGSYSSQTSGDNVLVSVGSSVITLSGAASLSSLNIEGTEINPAMKVALTSHNDTYTNTVSGATIAALGGNDTLDNTATNVSINAGTGSDSISNSGNYSTLIGGDGADIISNNDGNNSYISAGKGADSIKNYEGDKVTIDAGANDDYIINDWSHRVSVNASAGNDVISLISGQQGVTVKGGKGNDTIYGSNNSSDGVLYQYSLGDGNDVIHNWSSNDSLTIADGNSFSSVVSGNNVLISIEGSGTITLGDAKDKTINIYTDVTPDPGSDVSPQDVIKKFMGSLDTTNYSGVSALNEAIYVASDGYFSDIQSAIDSMINDCRNAKSADDFLKTYCGINLDNDDTGAITGYDAGGSTYEKNAEDIVPESGSSDSATLSSFTTNGLTIKLADVNENDDFYDTSYGSLTDDTQKYIWRALQAWWAKGALNLIAESYGSNFGFSSSSSATVKEMQFGFVNENSGTLASTWTSTSKKNYFIGMAVNMYHYNLIEIGDPDGKGSNYLDRTLAHEFTHAVMASNINYFHDLPQFITEGMAELTHGIDDESQWSINYLANNPDNLNLSLAMEPGTGTVGLIDAYTGGYMFLRYLAKQASEHYGTSNSRAANKYSINDLNDNVTISGSLLTLAKSFAGKTVDLTKYPDKVRNLDATALDTGLTVFGNANANSIATGSGDDKVFANTGNDKIFGGAGNDILHGDAGNDSVNGGAGADTINGGTGDDTLTGGKGNDLFIFGDMSGKDVITDYVAGKDSIKFTAEHTKIISASLSGNDVVLTLDLQSSITLRDAKDKEITVIDCTGKSTLSVYGSAGSDSLWGSKNAGAFVYSSDDNLIYGSDDNTPTLDELAITSSNKEDANALTFDNNSTAFKDYTATTSHVYDDTQQLNNSTHAKK